MKDFLKINLADNVAVAISPLSAGTTVNVDGDDITLVADIPAGHKFALCKIAEGENVIKYGFPIGHARHAVKKGAFLDHNDIKTNLEGQLDYSDISIDNPSPEAPGAALKGAEATFMGYERPDGQVGIRNEIWVIPTVGCVNGIAKQIVDRLNAETKAEGVDGIFAFPHNYGCSQLGDDHENTKKILRDMVLHPNAGGILVIGLGCENNQPKVFEEFCGDYDRNRVKFMVCQEVEGDEVEAGLEILRSLYEQARTFERTQQPASKLRIGLKCGGSDGFSGITANPLLGEFSDWLCEQQGGTTVLTEVPEMFGAETILMRRCADDKLLGETVSLINNFKEYFLSHGEPVGENPSPGNKAGGISTLEEKALGCTQKSGKSPVFGVMEYGERIHNHGLNLLSAPGNDLVASTALAAAGCQMVLFTTGRGTPFGTFVPTMKVSTNSGLAARKPTWIDFNAGRLAEDSTMADVLADFVAYVLKVASGEQVNSEKSGIHEISIFKNGVTL
ncbi:MAG: altronate dehydratase [Muribaculaceae bacterium]|uniref:Altronate dehydratase n=2 Tax=Duncaniella TaxID=2518495 RepID=A0A4P7W0R0_9BACT|nr:altronate dehydratase family protein [Duncaniella dubosii]MBJ2189657.1 altronate dehydratase [Muribaculaceae bacterium]MCX4284748.1 altronate dehydratase family protein [Duncaniella dubosii]QCD41443.1 altronate dehydratase [Duncaniella dubosii]HBN64005.1 altronate hydrolase [Porphyromonadaceae bacterium]